jgi:Transglycosylase SLT domain
MALAYIDKVLVNKAAFERRVLQMSKTLVIEPDWIMSVMYAESGLNHLAQNSKSTAIGLIQFLDNTLKRLGTTREAIKNMTNVKQLDYVEKYFISLGLKAKMKSIYDVYFAVFSPKFVGKTDSTVIALSGSSVYNANKALDTNKDGKILVSDVKTWFNKFIKKGNTIEAKAAIEPLTIAAGFSLIYLLRKWSKNRNITMKAV